jgi:hypothetical protein
MKTIRWIAPILFACLIAALVVIKVIKDQPRPLASSAASINTTRSFFSKNFQDRGFDPGMTHRLIATIFPNQHYFEDCPDAPTGQCYPDVLAGEGFYTLSPQIGAVNVPCRVNSNELFIVPETGQSEKCPFTFTWTQGANGRLAALLSTDTRNWSRSDTPNLWLGFQQNTPFGDLYMGANNMPNINRAYFEAYMSGSTEGLRTDQGAHGRFITGVGWYVPALEKSFVIEINLDSFNTTQPQLSTTLEAVDNPACGSAVKCLYLGGRFWGYGSILGTTPKRISTDWGGVIRTLVDRGYLPSQAYGDYPVTVFHIGPEMFGLGKISTQISGVTIKAKR